MVKYNRIIMSKMHNGGLFMLTIREIKKAATLEEAWQLNQKRPNRVVGGMLWMRLSKANVAALLIAWIVSVKSPPLGILLIIILLYFTITCRVLKGNCILV